MNTEDIAAAPPSAWVPERDLQTLALLGKFVEEGGETLAKVGRCICQGVHGLDPITGLPQNVKELQDEFADLDALLGLLIWKLGMDQDAMAERAKRKCAYLSAWLEILG